MAEQSREPEIIKSIIDDTEYNKTPQSRNEEILLSIRRPHRAEKKSYCLN